MLIAKPKRLAPGNSSVIDFMIIAKKYVEEGK